VAGEEQAGRTPVRRGRVVAANALGGRLVAEMAGTALLVVFGAGAVVAALRIGEGSLDYAGLGIIALAFGLVIAIVVYALGPVSGAHINPAVTTALAVTGRFPWRDVGPYVVAQLVGGALGGLLLVGVFGRQAVGVGLGGTFLADGVGFPQGAVAEAVGTFLLLLAVMAMAVDTRAPTGWAGWIIGLSVSCSIMVVGPLTGSSLNPARTFGPYLATTLFAGDVPWEQMAVYVAGPLAGALVATLGYELIARPEAAGEPALAAMVEHERVGAPTGAGR
jgi:glycerol uptake facilitator protein